jgi:predicted methyltransferase
MCGVNDLENFCRFRLEPKREFDQLPATPATMRRRLSFLSSRNLLRGRRVLLLGDDDLTSIAIALAGHAAHIAVLDVDEALLAVIARLAEEHGLRIELAWYDVRRPLPLQFESSFDLCFTDPPYTVHGFTGFLCRARCAVRNKGDIIACLSPSDVGPGGWRRCVESAERMGLTLSQVLSDFNTYDLAQRPWEHSTTEKWSASSLLWFTADGVGMPTWEISIDWNHMYDYESNDAETTQAIASAYDLGRLQC